MSLSLVRTLHSPLPQGPRMAMGIFHGGRIGHPASGDHALSILVLSSREDLTNIVSYHGPFQQYYHARRLAQKQPSPSSHHQNQLNTHHPSTPTPTIIPANFITATLFPCPAITPNRRAEPLSEVVMVLKVSEVASRTCWSRALS